MHKNLRVVPRFVYGRGSFSQLDEILSGQRTESGSFFVYLVDDVHEHRPLAGRLPLHAGDLLIWVNVDHEPKTVYVDELTERIRQYSNRQPDGIIGLGGGSTLDLTKAVAVLLTNPGSAADYQGWDLVKYPAVYKAGIPTLSGTGAEVSRTTVLTGPTRKLGINSDFTPFDQIVLDPDLLDGVSDEQRFFTAMDCYIHGAESINGTFINEFAQAYAEKSMDLCRTVFLGEIDRDLADEKLMVASYFGGLSIGYSQVGVCHALSYGLSFLLGTHHGVGNCVVFDQLGEFYPKEVDEFRRMMEANRIELPRGLCRDLSDTDFDTMIDVALSLAPLWENALGPDWKSIMTRERAAALYRRM
ncbi:MAG: iron-containing alcohol dehydrogenase [Puniceicoccaceae bacterium]|nr:MAG: iron-containing alcohol dehydrogenase [Puniceicoccaceae bacterium]